MTLRKLLTLSLLGIAAFGSIVPWSHGAEPKHPAKQPIIYVPYSSLQAVLNTSPRAVLMDRDAFAKLMTDAQVSESKPGVELAQVTHAKYTASADSKKVKIEGELLIESMSDRPVAMPLAFGHIGLTTLTLDNTPAPLGYTKAGQLVLIVTGRGKHTMKLAGTSSLNELSDGGQQFVVTFPQATAGSMSLSALGDLEIHATAPVSDRTFNSNTDRTTATLTIGGQGTLAVALQGNGRQDEARAILLTSTMESVQIDETYQSLSCLASVHVLRRGAGELHFNVPAGWTVVEVTSPEMVKWSIKTAKQDKNPGQILTVRMRTSRRGTHTIHIKASSPRKGERFAAPRISLVDAKFSKGLLHITRGENLRVRRETKQNARREDSPGGGRLYLHWGEKWSVGLELTRVKLRRSCKTQQQLTVSPQQLSLDGQFEFTALGRQLFSLAFELPAETTGFTLKNLQAVTVNGSTKGFEYRVTQQAGKKMLKIELARPIEPEAVVNVRILMQRTPSDWNWQTNIKPRDLAIPRIIAQTDTIDGLLSIKAADDLAVKTLKPPAGLKPVPVGRMASLGMGREIQQAYSYDAVSAKATTLNIRVSRQEARVRCDAVGLISAKPSKLLGQWRLGFNITRASTRDLRFLVAKSLGREISIVVPRHRLAGEGEILADQTDAPEGYTLWQVTLDSPTRGGVSVLVNYEISAEAGKLGVPLVRPALAESSEVLAVQASDQIAVNIKATAMREIDTIELPALPGPAKRLLAAYRLATFAEKNGKDVTLNLQTTVHQNYDIPVAMASLGKFITLIGNDGSQQTAATFHITNAGLQFLRFQLPDTAELWSVRVGEHQAKPIGGLHGDYQVVLPLARKPLPVKIVYATPGTKNPSLSKLTLARVTLPDLTINHLQWQVFAPNGYRISSQDSRMQTQNLQPPQIALEKLLNAVTDISHAGILSPSLNRASGLVFSDDGYDAVDEIVAPDVGATANEGGPRSHAALASKLTDSSRGKGMGGGQAKAPEEYKAEKGYTMQARIEGRYTLPVELLVPDDTLQAVLFSNLGADDLTIRLVSQESQNVWYYLGLSLAGLIGMLLLKSCLKWQILYIIALLAGATLLSVWLSGITLFMNGVFGAGIYLVLLYILVGVGKYIFTHLRPMRIPLGRFSRKTTAVLLLLSLSSLAMAGKAMPQPTSNPLIVPYEGNPTKADDSKKVFVPYAQFVTLWNQAHPDKKIDLNKTPVPISMAGGTYDAHLEGDRLVLTLSVQVKSSSTVATLLALPVKGLAVTAATLDGKPARLQSGPAGMAIMLPAGAEGLLKLSAVTTPKMQGRRGQVTFSLPPIPAATMTLLLPKDDLELQVPGIHGVLDSHTVAGGRAWTIPLGQLRSVKLTWSPKVGTGNADQTLSATVAHEVRVMHWGLLGASQLEYASSAGKRDNFGLLIPAEATLLSLKGANIRDSRVVETRVINTRKFKVIAVRLQRPIEGKYTLSLKWQRRLPTLDSAFDLLLPRPADVARESGTVSLFTAGGMEMKIPSVTGARRMNIRSVSTAEQAVARYYWPYRPFAMSLKLSRVGVKTNAHLDQLVRIGTDRVQLFVDATLQAKRGKLFGASFALPSGYELLSVVGKAVDDWHEQTVPSGKRLHVNFRRAVTQTKLAIVLIRKKPTLDQISVPIATAIDSDGNPLADQKGRLAVQVARSLTARTAGVKNLKPLAPNITRGWLNGNQASAVQFAYTRLSPECSVDLNIQAQPTRLRSNLLAAVTVRHSLATYTYRLRYHISGSPIDRVQFTLPSNLTPLLSINSPAMRNVTHTDLTGGQTQWTVILANEVVGTLDVTANFALPLDQATNALSIPHARTQSPQGQQTIVAVRNLSRHKLSLGKTTELTPLPLTEQRNLLSPTIRKSLMLVYRSFSPDWAMQMNFKPAPSATRVQAVIDLMAITTVIDRNGQCRYRVKLTLQNRSEQFLRFVLPEGLKLWSAQVAGQPVKPAKSADGSNGEVLIPLVKTSPGGLPYEVTLFLAGQAVNPLDGITKIQPPSVKMVGIGVMRTTWSLRLPGNYTYKGMSGNVSPIAGTAEMLSIGIDAKISQLRRLKTDYESIEPGRSDKKNVARKNLDAFNTKLNLDIQQAQTYLGDNRADISGKDFDRLNTLIVSQKSAAAKEYKLVQSGKIDQAANETDLNFFVNSIDGRNGGISDAQLNSRLQVVPGFVERAGKEQREAIAEGLKRDSVDDDYSRTILKDGDRFSTLSKKGLGKSKGDKATPGRSRGSDRLVQKLQLEQLESKQKRRSRAQRQLKQLSDNTMRLNTSQSASNGNFANGKFAQVAESRRSTKSGRDQRVNQPARSSVRAISGSEWSSRDFGSYGYRPSTPAIATVASGTFSLPIDLPEGEFQMDFARPGGDAELGLYAIPKALPSRLWTTGGVVLSVLIFGLFIWRWTRIQKRMDFSPKRWLGYFCILLLLLVILGWIGLIIAVCLFLSNELLVRPIQQAKMI